MQWSSLFFYSAITVLQPTGGERDNILPSWQMSPARHGIIEAVQRMSRQSSPDYVMLEDRVAIFVGDGVLWGTEMETADFAISFPRPEGPFEDLAAYSKQVRSHLVAEGPLAVGPRFGEYAYLPLKELIGYLRAQKFQIWIISSGDHEVDRAMAKLSFDVPRDRVIALPELEMEKAAAALKHVIWERIGKVPRILVGGAENDGALFTLADKDLSTLTVQIDVPSKASNQQLLSTYDLKSDPANTWDFVLSPKAHWQRTYVWQPNAPVGLTKN